MKAKEFYKKNKSMVWIFLIIVGLLLAFNSGEQTTDKKESFLLGSGIGLVVFGIILIVGGIISSPVGAPAVPIGIGMVIFGLGFGGMGISNLLSPAKSIPTWAYLAGFVAIILMIKKK